MPCVAFSLMWHVAIVCWWAEFLPCSLSPPDTELCFSHLSKNGTNCLERWGPTLPGSMKGQVLGHLWVISAERVPGLLGTVHCLAQNVQSLLTLRFCDSSSTSLSPTGSLVNNSWTEAVKLIPGRDFFHCHHMVSCDVPITLYGKRMQRSKVALALQAKARSKTLWFLELCCRI